jgi:uncharacterized protein YjbJ (UPF0337 family)
MDNDRVKGTVSQVGGKMKEAAGDLTGDEGLQAEGSYDQMAGATQRAYGRAKDTVKDVARHGQDYVGRVGEVGSSYYDDSMRAMERRIEERPLNSVMAAAAIGFAVGWLFRGRN